MVDLEDFSGRRGVYHQSVTASIPAILDAALRRAGIDGSVGRSRFDHSTGDGWVRGYKPAVAPLLVNPFLRALEEELAERDRQASPGHVPTHNLRMRVSLHVGPVEDSGQNLPEDGSGDARVAVHRLVDSEPARRILDRSDPAATHVVAVVSARAYEDTVVSGYAALPESLFHRMDITVKSYQSVAYIHVPRSSGQLLTEGFPVPGVASAGDPVDLPGSSENRDASTFRSIRIGGVGSVGSGSNVVGGDHVGPMVANSRDFGGRRDRPRRSGQPPRGQSR
ncbi:hypothetical protein [Frankia sp. R82]|uniref:hypothetical protein n=1 Tax=Frankia sp. R82 TaxID=2950553 RepID=UPI00204482F1|nr:hypothetical protein [Frankia sp. R82]MCM3885553.1 hypothetical protein [Frankia sp. R82]